MEQITYFVSHYGYLAIFILLMPGIFGIPVPDEIMLTFVGYLALRGDLRLISVVAVVAAGLVSGLMVDYWVGRAAAAGLIRRSGAWFGVRAEKLAGLEEWLRQRGRWALFLGNFFPGIRHWLPVAAGITTFPLASFSLFAYAGALAWSLLYIALGYFLGQEAGLLAQRLGAHCQVVLGLIIALLLGFYVIRGKWLWRQWPKVSRHDSKTVTP